MSERPNQPTPDPSQKRSPAPADHPTDEKATDDPSEADNTDPQKPQSPTGYPDKKVKTPQRPSPTQSGPQPNPTDDGN